MKRRRTFELPRPVQKSGETICEGLAISPDGRWLVTTAYRSWSHSRADGVADVWDLRTAKRVHRLAAARGAFGPVVFLGAGRIVLTQIREAFISEGEGRPAEEIKGDLALLDPLRRRVLGNLDTPAITPNPFPSVQASLLSPDRRTLYVGYNTGEVVAYETANGRPRRVLTGHQGAITALSITPDGRRLLSAGLDGVALVWDVSWKDANDVGRSR